MGDALGRTIDGQAMAETFDRDTTTPDQERR